jgi:hypothetical protein
MKKLFFAAMAAVAMMMVSCGGTKSENVTGDLQKDVKKCVEIMNKSGEVNNEDSKIMEEIAAYYEAEGKSKEFQDEFTKQLTASVTEDLDKAFEEGMKKVDEAVEEGKEQIEDAAKEVSAAAKELQ